MQFIKISKDIRKNLTQKESILYAMIAAYLSIPEYHTCSGGFKNMLRKRVNAGQFTFDNTWRSLQTKGYLKQFSWPTAENKFAYRYELRTKPDLQTAKRINLTALDAEYYLKHNPSLYNEPQDSYWIIDREVLLNRDLDFNAKWLYLVIQNQLDLFGKEKLKVPYITKEVIQTVSGFKSYTFEKAWKMLRHTGLLQAQRFFDVRHGVTHCEYVLSNQPATKALPTRIYGQNISENTPGTHNAVVDNTVLKPNRKTDGENITKLIKENIGYDELIRRSDKLSKSPLCGFSYSVKRLDMAVSTIVSCICSKKKHYRINGQNVPMNQIREILLSLRQDDVYTALWNVWAAEYNQSKIHNMSAYLLTTLYNVANNR